MQDNAGRVESGIKLIWRMTVLQTKYPLVGVVWPILAVLLWHLVTTLEGTIAMGIAYGAWRFDFLRTLPEPGGSGEQLLLEIGISLLAVVATAGIFALVGLAYGKATVRCVGLEHRATRWMPTARQMPRYLVASSLKVFLLLWAYAAFIFPGVYLTARLMYVQHALIDKDLGVWEAFRESWRLSDRAGGGLVGLVGWLLVIGILSSVVITLALFETSYGMVAGEMILMGIVGSDYVMAQAITYAELQEGPPEADAAAAEAPVPA